MNNLYIMNNNVQDKFISRVGAFASAHCLFVRGGKYIATLSGGADSVALLLAMCSMAAEWDIEVEAAHCNFRLRGDESDRDENFCKALCAAHGVALHLVHFDTREYASLHHVSIEMAARRLRYDYFERLRRDIGADGICVAHHRDDSVETVLLNLVRGTGIRGLRGIQPRNGHILRPMLSVSRSEIVGFLDSLGQPYVTDSTNLVPDVKRNKIRLQLMPLLQQLNPNVAQSIFETSLRVGEAVNVYDDAMGRAVAEVVDNVPDAARLDGAAGAEVSVETPVSVSIPRLLAQVSPESVLFSILSPCGFTSSQVEMVHSVMARQSDRTRVFASGTHELCFNRDSLLIQPLGYGVRTLSKRVPECGHYSFAEDLKFDFSIAPATADFTPSTNPLRVTLDADRIAWPLTVRNISDGDRFTPFGMKHSKLVSDFLTDRKRSVFDKRRQLVVADASGRIVWLVGERTDNRFRTTANTRHVLTIGVG